MKKWIPFAGPLFTILVLSYLEAPYSLINREHTQVASIPNEVLLADEMEEGNAMPERLEAEETSSAAGDEEIAPLNYSLEWVLERKFKEDGYIVETYRGYEFYRDENGQVMKKIPTANQNTLRYYDE